MTYISPLTEDEKRRRRRLTGMVEDGEVIGFDLAFRDHAPPALYMTDGNTAEREIIAEVNRQHGIHDAKFAFMGGAAPKFDRETALMVARSKRATAGGAAVRDAIRAAQYEPAPGAASHPMADSERALASGAAVRDAVRAARYAG